MTQSVPDRTKGLHAIFFIYCSLCFIALFNMMGCYLLEPAENHAALVVGSRKIAPDELKGDLEFISAGMAVPAMWRNMFRDKLLEQVIDHYLILEYGRENGITVSDDELKTSLREIKKGYPEDAFKEGLLRGYIASDQWKERLREHLAVTKIVNKVTESVNPPSHQDIMSYYKENGDQFMSPQMVYFRQIVTKTREEALGLLKRLRGGEKIDELAIKHSIAPEAENGGNVGWMEKGHLDESMENVLFSIPVGKISDVTKTPYGFHIFEVLEVRAEGKKGLPEVVSEIESKILETKRAAFCKKWLQELRSQFEVRINEETLNTMELS